MSRIPDIDNPHERTQSDISDSDYYTNQTESARTHTIDNIDYNSGFESGIEFERKRIIKNIHSRIEDLRACGKRDNCHELAYLIESYIPEWTDTDYLGKMIRLTQWAYTEKEQE